MSIGAGRITVSCVAGAIPGAVGGWNRRTSSFVTYGSNARVLGGTRSTAIRCWRFAVRSTMGHWIRWLCGINSGHEACKNYLMFPPAGPWHALCAVAGDQSDVWRGDAPRGEGAQGGAMLRDGSRNRPQRAAAHTGVEAAQLDRVVFSDLAAPPSARGLSGAP